MAKVTTPTNSSIKTKTPVVAIRDFPFKRGNLYYIKFPDEAAPGGFKDLQFPAVTSILQKSIPKQDVLMRWGAKVVAKKIFDNPGISMEDALNAINEVKTSAMGIGKTIHHFAERYSKGETISLDELDPSIRAYGEAFLSFIELHKPRVLFTEVCVFNVTHGYAGTADLIAVLSNGKTAILDWKTGKGTYKESHLQQMAYANAEWIYIPDTRNGKPQCIRMPKIDEQYLVHLKDNGTANLIPVKEPFEKFLKILDVYPVMQWLAEW